MEANTTQGPIVVVGAGQAGLQAAESPRAAHAAGCVVAGDCTVRRMADGGLLRLESVQSAVEQAKSAAGVHRASRIDG